MQKISDLKRKTHHFKLNSSDILPLAFLGLSVGMVCLTTALIGLAIAYTKLASKPAPTLVQQVDGRAYTVRSEDANHREPAVIRKTVADWAVMTFSWGNIPNQQHGSTESPIDPGIEFKGRQRIPTSTWEASFLLASNFRDMFLEKFAQDIISPGVFEGKVSAVLIPQTISPPQSTGSGRWKVDMVATRMVFDASNPAGYAIPFNRTFYVRAVEPPHSPLQENKTEYQRVAYRMLEAGLQIEEIRPLEED